MTLLTSVTTARPVPSRAFRCLLGGHYPPPSLANAVISMYGVINCSHTQNKEWAGGACKGLARPSQNRRWRPALAKRATRPSKSLGKSKWKRGAATTAKEKERERNDSWLHSSEIRRRISRPITAGLLFAVDSSGLASFTKRQAGRCSLYAGFCSSMERLLIVACRMPFVACRLSHAVCRMPLLLCALCRHVKTPYLNIPSP